MLSGPQPGGVYVANETAFLWKNSQKTPAAQPVKAGREGECETSDKGWTDLNRHQLAGPLAKVGVK